MAGGELVRFTGSGIVHTHEAALAPVPANRAPDYGLANIDWAWQGFKPGEYRARLEYLRKLMEAMNKIPPMHVHDFSGAVMLNTFSVLSQSFEPNAAGFRSWEDLVAHPSIGPKVEELVAAGAYGTRPEEQYKPSTPILDTSRLPQLDLNAILFDVNTYRGLPDEFKDFLNGINLLLVPHRQNRFRASISLRPSNLSTPADARYMRFYSRLVQLGYSCMFDVHGPHSMPDAFLGRYDRAAQKNPALPLFPQYAEGGPQAAEKVVVSKYKGPFYIDRTNTDFNAQVKQEMQAVILGADGQVDSALTEAYHVLANKFGGGALYIPYFKELFDVTGPDLPEDKVDFLSIALINYVFDSIQRGQLGDLQGLETMSEMLNKGIDMFPEVANMMRMFIDNLSSEAMMKVLVTIDTSGLVTADVSRLSVQTDSDEVNSIHPIAAAVRTKKPTIEFVGDDGRATDLSQHQEKLVGRLIDFVQEQLPGINVDFQIVNWLHKYGQVVAIMQGESVFLRDMQPALAYTLTRFLEGTMGRELPGMRKAIPYEARERLEQGDAAGRPPPSGLLTS